MTRLPEHIGRMRVNESEAQLLSRLLWDHRQEMMEDRKRVKGNHELTAICNRELHVTRKIWDELALLCQQKGWFIDEPERQDPQAADPRLPDREEGAMGRRV